MRRNPPAAPENAPSSEHAPTSVEQFKLDYLDTLVDIKPEDLLPPKPTPTRLLVDSLWTGAIFTCVHCEYQEKATPPDKLWRDAVRRRGASGTELPGEHVLPRTRTEDDEKEAQRSHSAKPEWVDLPPDVRQNYAGLRRFRVPADWMFPLVYCEVEDVFGRFCPRRTDLVLAYLYGADNGRSPPVDRSSPVSGTARARHRHAGGHAHGHDEFAGVVDPWFKVERNPWFRRSRLAFSESTWSHLWHNYTPFRVRWRTSLARGPVWGEPWARRGLHILWLIVAGYVLCGRRIAASGVVRRKDRCGLDHGPRSCSWRSSVVFGTSGRQPRYRPMGMGKVGVALGLEETISEDVGTI